MPYEFIPLTIGVFFIFGLIAFGLIRKMMADRERLQLRELLHRERMAAMEKDLPIDELKLGEVVLPEATLVSPRSDAVTWMRFAALFLGLAFFFGGIGMSTAFAVAPDRGFNDIWSLGLIPTLTGLGLLLFYYMTTGWQTAKPAK